ncbi:MAG: hypothetical protein R6V85_17550 [Polyangia bacterium]
MNRPKLWALFSCVAVALPGALLAQDAAQPDEGEVGAQAGAESGEAAGGEEAGDEAAAGESGQEAAGQEAAAEQPAAGAGEPGMDKGTYTVRLRDLEDRINRLKEQIFRSKARLSLLAETVLDRKIAGAKAAISFRNEMGGSFRLTKATFLLDGGPIFNKSDEAGSLSDREVIDLFDGPVMPGDHTLSVVLHYRGHGYGIFSYLKGYSFKVRSSRTFTVGEGKAVEVEVVGFEKGGVTTPLEERPAVRYVEDVGEYEGKAAAEKGEPIAEGAGEGL